MTTVKTGLFDTEDELSNRRVVDMSEKMRLLQPDDQQFRVALDQIGSKEAVREIVEWLGRFIGSLKTRLYAGTPVYPALPAAAGDKALGADNQQGSPLASAMTPQRLCA